MKIKIILMLLMTVGIEADEKDDWAADLGKGGRATMVASHHYFELNVFVMVSSISNDKREYLGSTLTVYKLLNGQTIPNEKSVKILVLPLSKDAYFTKVVDEYLVITNAFQTKLVAKLNCAVKPVPLPKFEFEEDEKDIGNKTQRSVKRKGQ